MAKGSLRRLNKVSANIIWLSSRRNGRESCGLFHSS
jgi:hypothetical protein